MGEQDEIAWGETIWINTLRAFFAGIVWRILLTPKVGPVPPDIAALPFILPLGFPFVAGFATRVFGPICSFFGFGFIAAPMLIGCLVGIIAGDPILFVLRLFKRSLVPAREFAPINLRYFIVIVRSPTVASLPDARTTVPSIAVTVLCAMVLGVIGLVASPQWDGGRNRRATVPSVQVTAQQPAAPSAVAVAPQVTHAPAPPPHVPPAKPKATWVKSPDRMWEVCVERGETLHRKPRNRDGEPTRTDPYFVSRVLIRTVGDASSERELYSVRPGNEIDRNALCFHTLNVVGWSPKGGLLALSYTASRAGTCSEEHFIVLLSREGKPEVIPHTVVLRNLRSAGLDLDPERWWDLEFTGFSKDGGLRVKLVGQPSDERPDDRVVTKSGECSLRLLRRVS